MQLKPTVAEREAAAAADSGEEDGVEIDLEQWRSSRGVTGYIGVNMLRGQYQAKITLPSGIRKFLGIYDTVEEAARAHARKYLKIHGGPPEMEVGTVAEREAAAAGSGDDVEIV